VWSRSADGIPFRGGQAGNFWGGVEADSAYPVLANGEITHVPEITLDDFVVQGNAAPKLVKIDVEGGEYEVLHGVGKFFATQRSWITTEVHHQQTAEHIKLWRPKPLRCLLEHTEGRVSTMPVCLANRTRRKRLDAAARVA